MLEKERWGELGRTETRKRILENCGYKCQMCGRTFDKTKGWYPHIHHKAYSYKVKIENFEVLCKVCHGKKHPNSKFYNLDGATPPCIQGNIRCKDCPDYSDGLCSWSLPVEKPIRDCNSANDVEILIKYTQSESPVNRRLAAKALSKLSTCHQKINEAVPHLLNLLDDNNHRVRRYTIKALDKIGDKRALNKLHEISKNLSEVDYNRKVADLAIKNIESLKVT